MFTSRFDYGDVPAADGVTVREHFYRHALPGPRRFTRLAQHVPDMLRYRRAARAADVVHFQWLSVQALDVHLLPSRHPRILTAHDVLPREPKPSQLAGQRRLYERMDAIVVHSEHGAARLGLSTAVAAPVGDERGELRPGVGSQRAHHRIVPSSARSRRFRPTPEGP